MRATLLGGLLLLVLAVGVVQSQRGGEGDGLLSGWIRSRERARETAAAPASGRRDEPPPATPEAARGGAPEAASPAAPKAAPAVLAAGELSVLEPEDEDPMVRYFDAEGSIHMVRGLARVPAELRADAVVLASANVNLVNVPAPTAVAFRDWQPDPNPNRSDVVLFSAPWCGACKRARRYLDRRGIPYFERDIDADDDAKQEVRSILGRVAVPLLEVNGRYISGFRADVYDRALGSG